MEETAERGASSETHTSSLEQPPPPENAEEGTITRAEHPTGSSFTGATVHGRMEGRGQFVFPTGTRYEGGFKDGQFHGKGTLYFTNGGQFEAVWKDGYAVGEGSGGTYTFQDGLKHKENDWEYCNLADRRFYSEICNGIKPAGRTQITNKEPSPSIPLGWYDCGNGVYNPENRVIYTYKDQEFLRNADIDEHEWILRTCRKGVTMEEQLSEGGLFK